MKRLLVTGGLGFIGSHFVTMALDEGYHVTNIDKRTYAARKDISFDGREHYDFIEEDICKMKHLPPGMDAIVNFAAESHVDNSITANRVFFETNIGGVYNLLELIRAKDPSDRPLLVHISTDEVYGSCSAGRFTELDRLNPSSPYSSTKAAADELIFAWRKTYGIRYKICRSCNNYGVGQHPEKLFAKTFAHLLDDKKMTVHGDGSYQREWMFVEDNCRAILAVLEKGAVDEIYNISSGEERSVLEVVTMIAQAMGRDPKDWIEYVENRSGQDGRYACNADKVRSLGWNPYMTMDRYIPRYLELCKRK